MVCKPKIEVSYLKRFKQYSYELEASTVNQDRDTSADDVIEWFQKFTDFDIDEYFIEILKNPN